MVLCLLPVLPPELRPIYHIDEDKLVTLDINEIYRRIIYWNNTLTDILTTCIATQEDLIISQENFYMKPSMHFLIMESADKYSFARLCLVNESIILDGQ
ncbi:hypothetical protein R6Q59_006406 [Mikania micrantha]